ncbi:MAG: hypothetical protein MUF17_12585, partial [Syntrophales bacterium]|nr:hypothetical protein [Syntrophales bacterium]
VSDFVGEPVASLGDVESHDDPLPARWGAFLKKRPVTNLFRGVNRETGHKNGRLFTENVEYSARLLQMKENFY